MKKNTYILGGILIVLILLALLVLHKPGEQSSRDANNIVFKIDSSTIDKIELKTPASSITLEKRGVEWFITRPIAYKASAENIAQVISQVKAMESKSTVTSKAEKYPTFDVTDAGSRVTLSAGGKEQASFIVGKMGTTYMETYIRPASSTDVLLVSGIFGFTFNRPVKEWRDKTIFKTGRDALNQIAYQYGDTTFVLSSKNQEWFIGSEKANKSLADDIASQLSNLRCSDFVDTAVTPAPKTIATISYANVRVLFAFDKPSGKYIVQASDAPQQYIMEPWQAQQILKRKKDFLAADKN